MIKIVLDFQHKFKEALDILDGPLGQQLEQQTSHLDLVEHKKMEYLKKLDKWDQVYTLSLKLLQKRYQALTVYFPKKLSLTLYKGQLGNMEKG